MKESERSKKGEEETRLMMKKTVITVLRAKRSVAILQILQVLSGVIPLVKHRMVTSYYSLRVMLLYRRAT
jgi:hypothetical protein